MPCGCLRAATACSQIGQISSKPGVRDNARVFTGAIGTFLATLYFFPPDVWIGYNDVGRTAPAVTMPDQARRVDMRYQYYTPLDPNPSISPAVG